MPKVTDQLFDDFVHFVTVHGYGDAYTRDPRESVPPDCGFVRFRSPGEDLFTSSGLMKFRTREEGVTACKAFVERRDTPMELQMNFPREAPLHFPSPTFAEAHAVAKSRWCRLKRAFGAWRHMREAKGHGH